VSVYSRQQELPLTVPERATICGCGGIGFWVALYLVMAGIPKVDLVDPDVVEESNLNRLPLPHSSVGQRKVTVLRSLLSSLRPDAVVMAYAVPVSEFLLRGLSPMVLVDCTDDPRAQELCYKYCCNNGTRYVRAGYNGGTHITITSTVAEWDAGVEGESPRYTIVPSFVAPAVIAAGLAVVKVMLNPELEFGGSVDLRRDYETKEEP